VLYIQVDVVIIAEIMAGSILFEDNYGLCYIDTIDWSDVLTHRRSNSTFLLNDPHWPKPNCNCQLLLNMSIIVKEISASCTLKAVSLNAVQQKLC